MNVKGDASATCKPFHFLLRAQQNHLGATPVLLSVQQSCNDSIARISFFLCYIFDVTKTVLQHQPLCYRAGAKQPSPFIYDNLVLFYIFFRTEKMSEMHPIPLLMHLLSMQSNLRLESRVQGCKDSTTFTP